MVEITASATEQVAEYFKGKDTQPIRIFLNEGGWGGPSVAMALDERKDSDQVYNVDGFEYIVDKDFMEKASPIKVDFLINGFKIDCGMEFKEGCTSCATTGECC